jgi:hypothetical protein
MLPTKLDRLIENSRQFAESPKKGVDSDLPTGMSVQSVMLQCFRRDR